MIPKIRYLFFEILVMRNRLGVSGSALNRKAN